MDAVPRNLVELRLSVGRSPPHCTSASRVAFYELAFIKGRIQFAQKGLLAIVQIPEKRTDGVGSLFGVVKRDSSTRAESTWY